MSEEHELRAAAYEAVAFGEAEVIGERDGEPVFRLTEAGKKRAEEIIDSFVLRFGHEAPEKLAEQLGVSYEIGEKLVDEVSSRK